MGFPTSSSEAVVNNPSARAIHPYGRFALDLDSPSFLEPAAEQTTPKLTPVRRYTLPLRLIAAPLPVTTYGSPERRNLLKAAPPLPTYVANSRRFMASGTGRKTHFDGLRGIGRQPGGQQAFRKKAADAVDGHGRPPFAANPHRGVKRRLALHATQADAPAEATVPDDEGVASALAWSR